MSYIADGIIHASSGGYLLSLSMPIWDDQPEKLDEISQHQMTVAASKKLTFAPAKALKDALNK
ncbi:hypothetical protein [Agrobacterium sp. CG674]